MQDEQQMLASFASGDYSAMETLVLRYEHSLFNLCLKLTMNRQDAEDLYQQMWLKAMQNPLRSTRSFKNWMYTICINTYRDSCRKQSSRQTVSGSDEAEYALLIAPGDESAENAAIKRIERQLLVSKVAKLADKHRITVILYYFEGLDYKECAAVLGLPVGTIKSRLNFARKALRSQMEEELHV